jgi:hypothetical protein
MRRVGIYAGHSTAHPWDITECEMNGIHTFTALANEQTAAMLGTDKAESGLQRYWLILCVVRALISKAFSSSRTWRLDARMRRWLGPRKATDLEPRQAE